MSERQSIPIRMWRADARQPWGFRLQGGADFGQPLTVQKVRRSSFVLFSFFFSNTFASKKNLSPPPSPFPFERIRKWKEEKNHFFLF